MTGKPHYCEVFYVDQSNGWALALYDADRNQLGDALYDYHRADCIGEWKKHFSNFDCLVFKKDNNLAFVKKPAKKPAEEWWGEAWEIGNERVSSEIMGSYDAVYNFLSRRVGVISSSIKIYKLERKQK